MEWLRFLMVVLLQYVILLGYCRGISGGGLDKMNVKSSSNVFDVSAYGAVGDGKTDDSQAFQKAWTKMCGSIVSPSPTLYIPPGKTFLLKPVTFKGPCKSPKPQLLVLGNIVAPDNVSAWHGFDPDSWIVFSHVNGLIIKGRGGQIDGRGSVWWNRPCSNDLDDISDVVNCPRPTALIFSHCDGLRLWGLKHLNSQRNHIKISHSNNLILSDLNITAPEYSPNTDGIDISSSSNIRIKDSFIGTGDDCIAINGGSSFINITNVNCGPGHGISVGSLGADKSHDTVEEIHVQGSHFTKTMNGLRIKTWQGGSGYARKISFSDISLEQVRNPIIIDQFYCTSHHGRCMNYTSAVEISDVTFSGVHGTSSKAEAINLSCSQSVGCSNIVMNDIKIIAASTLSGKKTYSFCFNAHGKAEDTTPEVSCLSS